MADTTDYSLGAWVGKPGTVADWARAASAAGMTTPQIASAFRNELNLDIRRIPPQTRLKDLPIVAKTLHDPKYKEFAPDQYRAPPEAGVLERVANWAGGVALRAPAALAGAMSKVPNELETPQFAPDMERRSIDAVNAEARKLNPGKIDAIRQAADENRAIRQGRAGTSTARTFTQDVSDVAAGFGKMIYGELLNQEGPPNQSPMEAARAGWEFGEKAGPAMVGGPIDMVRGLADPKGSNTLRTQPVSAVLTAMPAARGLRAGGLAGAEAAAARGGRVGRAGAAVARGIRSADGILENAGKIEAERAPDAAGVEAVAAEVADRVKQGHITPEQAAKIMEDHTPFTTYVDMGSLVDRAGPVGRGAFNLARGAAIGALVGDATMGAAGGALAGAGVEAARMGASAVGRAIGRRTGNDPVANAGASYRRNVADPAAQADPGLQEVARGIVEPPVEIGAEMQDIWTEAGGLQAGGEVAFKDVPPGDQPYHVRPHSKTVTVDKDGRLIDFQHTAATWEPSTVKPTSKMKLERGEALQELRDLKAETKRIWDDPEQPKWIREDIRAQRDAAKKRLDELEQDHIDQLEEMRLAKKQGLDPDASVRTGMSKRAAGLARGIDAAPDINEAIAKTHATAASELGLAPDEHVLPTLDIDAMKDALTEMKHGEPTWNMGLDVASDTSMRTGPRRRNVLTEGDRFNELVHRAAARMNSAGQSVPTHWFRRVMTDTMNRDSLGLLFDPMFRGRVVEYAAKFVGLAKEPAWYRRNPAEYNAFRKSMDDRIVNEVNKAFVGDTPKGIVLRRADGHALTLEELVSDVLDKNPDQRAAYIKSSMTHMGRTIANMAEDAHLAASIDRELGRFVPPGTGKEPMSNPQGVRDLVPYAARLFEKVVEDGHTRPGILPYDPAAIVSDVRGQLAQGQFPAWYNMDLSGPASRAPAVMRLLNQLETRYEPATPAVAAYLKEQRAAGLLKETPGEGVWIDKGLNATLDARVKLLQASRQADWVSQLTSNLKLNQTAYRLLTWTNNISSNGAKNFIAYGENPMTMAMHDVGKMLDMKRALSGGEATPADLQKWHGASRHGLGNLQELGPELEALGAMSSPHGFLPAKMHHMSQIARKGYAYGDMPFKVGEFSRAYDMAMGDALSLEPGEWARLRISGNRGIDLVRTEGGFTLNGENLPEGSPKLADVIAKSAVERAQESFINAQHSPVWLQKLRAGKVVGIASPFLSWAWGAVDLPGKPGLLTRTVMYDGGVILDTNNPTLLARNAARATEIAVRRGAVLGMLKANLSPDRDKIREALPYLFGDEGAWDVQPTNDELTITVKNYDAMNPFSRAALAWRVGQAGLALLFGPKVKDDLTVAAMTNYSKADDAEKRRIDLMRKLNGGQLGTMRDVMDLAMLSGNTMLDLARDLEDASSPGSNKHVENVLLGFALSTLVPGTLADAGKVVAGIVDEHSTMANRPSIPMGQHAGPVDAGKWAVERLLGFAYRDANMFGDRGKAKLFLTKYKAALKQSIVSEAERRLDRDTSSMLSGRITMSEFKARAEKQAKQSAMAQTWVDLAVSDAEIKLMTGMLGLMGNSINESTKAYFRKTSGPEPEATDDGKPDEPEPDEESDTDKDATP